MQRFASTKAKLFGIGIAIFLVGSVFFIANQATKQQSNREFASNDAGTVNAPCRSDNTCDAGLFCVYDPQSITKFSCVLPKSAGPYEKAAPGDPCTDNGQCVAGSICGKIADGYYCIHPSGVPLNNPNGNVSQPVQPTIAQTTQPSPPGQNQPTSSTQPVPSQSASNPNTAAQPSVPPRQLNQTCNTAYHCDSSQGLVCNNLYGTSGYCVQGGSQ